MMNRRITYFTALTVCCAAHLRADDNTTVQLPPKENFHLFLLAGQSNMAGRGEVEDQDRRPLPRVLMLTKDNQWKPAVDPIHFDKPEGVGVGPGRSFGIKIAKDAPDITVGLIPCAVGGSPIGTWKPKAHHKSTDSHPYDDAVRRTKIALQAGTLKAILWHQGESDASTRRSAAYEKSLHTLIARLRKEFNAPNLPFIVGQMGRFREKPWTDGKKLVDDAHRTLPKKVPHTAYVRSTGLKHRGDKVHFDAPSARALGKRYAKEYQKFESKK